MHISEHLLVVPRTIKLACSARQTSKDGAPGGWLAVILMATPSLSVSTLPWASLRLPKNNIGTPRLVVLLRKVKSATLTNIRGLNCGYVDIVIVFFVLGVAVGVTMGGWFVIQTPNTSSAATILLMLPTARALSFVDLLLALFALTLLFAVVSVILPVIDKH